MKKGSLKPYLLVFYSLKHLPQKTKVKVLRQLAGYQETKAGKVYEHDGLVQRYKAEKLGANVLLVPSESYSHFQNFLSESNISVKVREVWL